MIHAKIMTSATMKADDTPPFNSICRRLWMTYFQVENFCGEESNDNIHHRTSWNLWFSVDFIQFRILKSDLKVNCVWFKSEIFVQVHNVQTGKEKKVTFHWHPDCNLKTLMLKGFFGFAYNALVPDLRVFAPKHGGHCGRMSRRVSASPSSPTIRRSLEAGKRADLVSQLRGHSSWQGKQFKSYYSKMVWVGSWKSNWGALRSVVDGFFWFEKFIF